MMELSGQNASLPAIYTFIFLAPAVLMASVRKTMHDKLSRPANSPRLKPGSGSSDCYS